MPVFRLTQRLEFPPPELAEDGLLAVGGDLRPERLVLAYSMGIFPWYEEGQPILWHSPDPRMVLRVADLRVPRSVDKARRKGLYAVTLDTAFDDVIRGCATAPRNGQRGTWITPEMQEPTASFTARVSRTRPRPGPRARSWAGSTGFRWATSSSASRCSRARPMRRRSRSWLSSGRSRRGGYPRGLPGPHRPPGPFRGGGVAAKPIPRSAPPGPRGAHPPGTVATRGRPGGKVAASGYAVLIANRIGSEGERE